MIEILYQDTASHHARRFAADLKAAFSDHIRCELVGCGALAPAREDPQWDDLLVVFFDRDFPDSGSQYIQKYLEARPDRAQILPIAISLDARIPAEPISLIKAMQYDPNATGSAGAMVHRAGAMLNLWLQGRDAKIFLSHRAKDGSKIARQLYDRFESIGYRPWLDQAKEADGDTHLLPGKQTTQSIENALEDAKLLLLIDTPAAPESEWIHSEITTANGMLLPVLPIHFWELGDPSRGCRFRSLQELRRFEPVPMPDPNQDDPLTESQLEQIVHAAERYLCEILQRKCRVPFTVEQHFKAKGYDWTLINENLMMFRSQRKHTRGTIGVLSHCSIFHVIYQPALELFRRYLAPLTWANHKLFIYDGPLLPNHLLKEMLPSDSNDPIVLLNYQEVAFALHSHFQFDAA